MTRPRDEVLFTLALFGVFAGFMSAAFDMWQWLGIGAAFSIGCVLLMRDRDMMDALFMFVAAFVALIAILIFTGDRSRPHWRLWLFGFATAAAALVLLTRHRRKALLSTVVAICCIVAFRSILAIVRYALQH